MHLWSGSSGASPSGSFSKTFLHRQGKGAGWSARRGLPASQGDQELCELGFLLFGQIRWSWEPLQLEPVCRVSLDS